MDNRLLEIEPIHGWGWSSHGVPDVRDTPRPFKARVTGSADQGWTGKVETPDHEFDGQAIALSTRHAVFDGHVNVILEVATGYAIIG